MKKSLFLLAMLALSTLGVNAQVFVGGSFGFTSSKLSNDAGYDKDGTSYQILPEIGYQMDENMAIGIQIGYAHGYAALGSLSTTDFLNTATNFISMAADLSEDDVKLNSFSFAPFVRYNVLKMGPANIFIEGSVRYSSIKTDDTPQVQGQGGGELKFDAFEINVRPGISCNLGGNLSVLAKVGTLGFLSAKEKESEMKITRYGLSADSYNLLLGLNYHF